MGSEASHQKADRDAATFYDVAFLVATTAVWWASNTVFYAAIRRSLDAVPDVMLHSMFQLLTGALLGVALWLVGRMKPFTCGALRPLNLSAFFLYIAAVMTNASCNALSVSFASVIRCTEPMLAAFLLWLWRGDVPTALAFITLVVVVAGILSTFHRARMTQQLLS